jgi:phosphatidylserine/phosphatidylglycerophosphate/cardiolipin synthase-like enzyme
MLEWMLIGVGFTGAFTLVHLYWVANRKLGWIPSVESYFSPKGGCADAVVRQINTARREILMQAYSFTCPEIAIALIAARKRGVGVTILLDHSNEAETYSELKDLEQHDLKPLIDANHAIAHNKIMIIDSRTLITGSFNFTRQADHENAENLLVFHHHPELIDRYRKNFLAHKDHCLQPGTAKQQVHVGRSEHHHQKAA